MVSEPAPVAPAVTPDQPTNESQAGRRPGAEQEDSLTMTVDGFEFTQDEAHHANFDRNKGAS